MKKIVSLILLLAMILSLSVSALAADTSSFDDVSQSNWAYQYVERAAKEGWVGGVGDNQFNPDGKVTSAEWYTMVIRAFFADKIPEVVPAGQWFSEK